MKLATRKHEGRRDGQLVVVSRDARRLEPATAIASSLQDALDDWDACAPALQQRYAALDDPEVGEPLRPDDPLTAPLPRAYEWLDGSTYLSHVERVRKARGAAMPERLRVDPLVYQGGSGVLLGPRDPLELPDPAWGLDFEGEVCVVVGDTPRGTSAAQAHRHIRLVMLANDVSYRNLIADELQKGFGFVISKPATAFAPLALTPEALGPAWRGGRLHHRLRVTLNGERVGDLPTGGMHFSFCDLIAHICQTRSLTAGTIIGSGTVSSDDPGAGVSCLAERRMLEIIDRGAASTPYLSPGDVVSLEVLDQAERSVFGAIHQTVTEAQSTA